MQKNPFLFDTLGTNENSLPCPLSDDILFRHVWRVLFMTDLRKSFFECEPTLEIAGIEVPGEKGKSQAEKDFLLLEQGMIYFSVLKSLGLICDVLGIEKDGWNDIVAPIEKLIHVTTQNDVHVYAMTEKLFCDSEIRKISVKICEILNVDYSETGLGKYKGGYTIWTGGRGFGAAMTGLSMIGKKLDKSCVKDASAFVSYNQVIELFNEAFPDLKKPWWLSDGFKSNEAYSGVEKEVDGVPCLEVMVNGEPKLYRIAYKSEEAKTKMFSKEVKEIYYQFVVIPFDDKYSVSSVKTLLDVICFGTVIKPNENARAFSLAYHQGEVKKYLYDEFREKILGISADE